jgi:hypothetical protein
MESLTDMLKGVLVDVEKHAEGLAAKDPQSDELGMVLFFKELILEQMEQNEDTRHSADPHR